jgi:hypothetical protein
MAIHDELEKSPVAAGIGEEAERTVQELLAKSGVTGAISILPFGVGFLCVTALIQMDRPSAARLLWIQTMSQAHSSAN